MSGNGSSNQDEAMKCKSKIEELVSRGEALNTTFSKAHEEINEIVDGVSAMRKQLEFQEFTEEEARTLKDSLDKLEKDWKAETGGLFVKSFLGEINTKAYYRLDKLKMKSEYEAFKRKANWIYLFLLILSFGLVKWLFPRFSAVHYFLTLITEVWCLYYYISLLLREHILIANGSRIRKWWLHHHYISIACCVVIMFWEDSPSRANFHDQFLLFLIFQVLVQHLLNRYQLRRLYRMITLGVAGTLDVMPETELDSKRGMWDNAWLLLPFIFATQVFEFFCSFSLFMHLYITKNIEWQPVFVGVFMLIIATGNFTTTTLSYIEKWRIQKREKEKQTTPKEKTEIQHSALKQE